MGGSIFGSSERPRWLQSSTASRPQSLHKTSGNHEPDRERTGAQYSARRVDDRAASKCPAVPSPAADQAGAARRNDRGSDKSRRRPTHKIGPAQLRDDAGQKPARRVKLLAISRNQALFALLGTTYGADGQSTFGLPTAKPIFTATEAPLTQCIALQGVFPSRS